MQARGPLRVEHRLIERMIALMRGALARIESTRKADLDFIDRAVDFLRTYADRTHHGKEEDVLFKALSQRRLKVEDGRLMKELLDEHGTSRATTKALVEATIRYRQGDTSALKEMADRLRKLVDLYPEHIRKEDKVFFPAARTYFTEKEDQAMLAEFRDFDRKMIHEKYGALVRGLEGK